MKAGLGLKTYGVKGGEPNWKNNVGQTVTFIDNGNDHIGIDAFQGFGNDYKRRDESVISIEVAGVSWSGTKKELAELIKKTQK